MTSLYSDLWCLSKYTHTKQKNMKHASNSIINSHIEVKFRTGVASDKAIPQNK